MIWIETGVNVYNGFKKKYRLIGIPKLPYVKSFQYLIQYLYIDYLDCVVETQYLLHIINIVAAIFLALYIHFLFLFIIM